MSSLHLEHILPPPVPDCLISFSILLPSVQLSQQPILVDRQVFNENSTCIVNGVEDGWRRGHRGNFPHTFTPVRLRFNRMAVLKGCSVPSMEGEDMSSIRAAWRQAESSSSPTIQIIKSIHRKAPFIFCLLKHRGTSYAPDK